MLCIKDSWEFDFQMAIVLKKEGISKVFVAIWLFFVWKNFCGLSNKVLEITLQNVGGAFFFHVALFCFFIILTSYVLCYICLVYSVCFKLFSLALKQVSNLLTENVAQYIGWQDILGLMEVLSLVFGLRSDSGSLSVTGKTGVWHKLLAFSL